jgi:hypothetical protein
MRIVLIENRGKHLAFVNEVLSTMGVAATKEDNNENVAVIKDMDEDKVIAVIGFNSDAGTNYHTDMREEHEILYMEPYSKVTSNDKYTDEIKKHTSLWLLNYLTRSVVASSSPLGFTDRVDVFQVGINVAEDKENILTESYSLVRNTFEQVARSLGFSI